MKNEKQEMTLLSYIISILLLSFMVFLIVKGIVRFIKNDRGWRRMEEDRKAKGMPFYGELEDFPVLAKDFFSKSF